MNKTTGNAVLAALITLPLMFSGCGGDNGGAVVGNSSGITSISGIVIDDYLDGADVCLDANNNGVCDAGDLKATTINGGKYTINNVTAADAGAPLLAFVGAKANIIDATTGSSKPFGKTVAFSTPGGQKDANGNQNITPFTTMIKRVQDKTGATATAAESQVKQSMGLTGNGVDLFGDYAATIAGDPYAVQNAKLLKVAQATTLAIADNYAAINKAIAADAALSGTTLDQIIALIVDQVLANLGAVTTAVDAYTVNGVFDAAAAAQAVPPIDTYTTNLQTQFANLAAQKTAANAVAAAPGLFQQIITTTGLSNIWGWSWFNGVDTQINYNIDKSKVDAATGQIINQSWYNSAVGNNYTGWQVNNYTAWLANNYTGWVQETAANQKLWSYEMLLDAATGAITVKNWTVDQFVTFNADGTGTMTFGSLTETFTSPRKTDLTGLPITAFINKQEHGDGWLLPLVPNATFTSPNAQAWTMTNTKTSESYNIWMGNDPLQCQQVGVTPYVAGQTNCNAEVMRDIYGNAVWDVVNNNQTLATTFADIIIVDPYAGLTDLYTISMLDPFGIKSQQLLATTKAATTGTVRYFDWQTQKYIGVATWNMKTVAGKQIVFWNYPAAWIALNSYRFAGIYVQHQGYVYQGDYTPAGFVSTNTMFNDAAVFDLKNAVGLPSPIGQP
ncbi:MAG: hypothetical protein R8L53_03455 [Mariprofundales bacterium]